MSRSFVRITSYLLVISFGSAYDKLDSDNFVYTFIIPENRAGLVLSVFDTLPNLSRGSGPTILDVGLGSTSGIVGPSSGRAGQVHAKFGLGRVLDT